jgi:hypothetical protein
VCPLSSPTSSLKRFPNGAPPPGAPPERNGWVARSHANLLLFPARAAAKMPLNRSSPSTVLGVLALLPQRSSGARQLCSWVDITG